MSDEDMSVSVHGRIAYEAYSRATDGISLVSGDKLPEWDDVEPLIQDAWHAAATAVRVYYEIHRSGHPPLPAGMRRPPPPPLPAGNR